MKYLEVVARKNGQTDRTRFHGWKLNEVKRIALKTYGKEADISIFDHSNNAPYDFQMVALKYSGHVRFANI